jgi:uncharacterized protein (DUF1697 family)
MKTYVALLRAINVGGKNKLPMAELSQMFARAGCERVRTYIQSGNVVFGASPKSVAGVCQEVREGIRKRFRIEVPLVWRAADEMQAVLRENPYAKRARMEDAVSVMFLADRPEAARLKALDPERSPGDEYIVRGREIYLWLPNGMGRSKLTNAYFDSKLATVSTARNWRTVLKLVEMMDAS